MPDLSQWSTSDLIAFVTIIILGISLIAPVFVAHIQRKTELKSKMLDIYKENYHKRYNREYYIFQDYIEKSGVIITKLDSYQRPTTDEIQTFESASLKCLIFLDDNERTKFDTFRIAVKKSLGIDDPREKKTPLHPEYFKEIQQAFANLAYISRKTIVVNPIYSSFNDCINIAAQRLATIEEEEQERLHSVQVTLLEHLHQKLTTLRKRLMLLGKSVWLKVSKLSRTNS
ncbi:MULTISPECIES: hypothetical protein [unclassified Streptococcus]|uniref:hypothetical protein n=1 Tax=unclassified Streptococcus TaxID=2608887 RepID=UPI00211B3089|nr:MULTISPECIES: hypothetical protein [unclassified Streptococcus]MCQ9211849.1 hypothetical protein [Streptococcus sp. B01]MCQ9212879.1 hypothetical protein [Streptococcus sp. B01]MCQ9212970.1 hypothetical protein [Streptococcus sp. O1]MCQ9214995.1 hypothetical protein [Streptococcus sp. O1]